MKTVYIAHPLAGDGSPEWGDQAANVERYLRFVAWASNDGHAVISWVHHHLCEERGLIPGGADYCLPRDAALLKSADELWVCGPPEVSGGTRFEIAEAERLGIPIHMEPEWMAREWVPC